jgi:hypothetical protein
LAAGSEPGVKASPAPAGYAWREGAGAADVASGSNKLNLWKVGRLSREDRKTSVKQEDNVYKNFVVACKKNIG